jgi:hypothetical protein
MKTYCAVLVVVAAAILPPPVLGQKTEEAEKVVKLTLHPMAEPRPALKYQLLPPFLDRRPGNAAVAWNGILAEQTPFFNELYKEGGPWEKIDQWMKLPLGDPREKEFRAKEPVVAQTAVALYRRMAYAARFESCDWQLPFREGNPLTIPLPEVQQSRTFGRLLSAKARLETAEGKYGRAVETIQTGFALARDVAKGQTLVNALVGVAIASLMTPQIEQFIQQPDAPNLYWALATLPRPLVDFRPAFEEESSFVYLQFLDLRELDKKDLVPEQWSRLLENTVKELSKLEETFAGRLGSEESKRSGLKLSAAAMAVQGYPVAKQYLVEHGRAAAEVEAMPVAKVILLYSVELYQGLSDEQYKLTFLPYAEGERWYAQADRMLKQAAAGRREIIPLTLLLPLISAAKHAETRMEWTIARLRIFEALRIYAAAHDGRLPDRLDDVGEVPIPRNPFDDKPFNYRREGNRAVLTSEHGPRGLPWTYEITMLPKGDKP